MSHLNSTSKSRRKRRRYLALSISLACGIVTGMNASPFIIHAANAAGITIPQTWAEDTGMPIALSDTLGNVPQVDIEHKTNDRNFIDRFTSPENNIPSSIKKREDVTQTENETSAGADEEARIQQLQAILDGGMTKNFSANADAFYVPLEGHTAPSGMTLIGVRGTFVTASAGQNLDTAIAHINEIRKDAYNSGLVDRYVPISRAPALERTAQIRAVEATVYPTHTRPNGKDFSSISAEGFASGSVETIAWGGKTLHAAIDQWAGEKQNYINARNGKNTGESGHYAALIDPNNRYVGLGMFKYSSGYGTTIVGRFASSNPSGPSTSLSGSVIQGIYVPTSAVTDSVEFTLRSSSIGSKAVFSSNTKAFNAKALLEAEIKK